MDYRCSHRGVASAKGQYFSYIGLHGPKVVTAGVSLVIAHAALSLFVSAGGLPDRAGSSGMTRSTGWPASRTAC